MDRASDFGSDGCGFESRRGRLYLGVNNKITPTCEGCHYFNHFLGAIRVQPGSIRLIKFNLNWRDNIRHELSRFILSVW